MATSSSFLSIPLPKTSSLLSPVKHCASPLSSEFRALSLYGGRNGVSTSSAMATEAQISTQDDKLKDEENNNIWKNGCTACAHVMAMAVQKLFPDAKVTIGPWIENGFYYDFDMEPLTDKELKRIKKEMDRIIGRSLPLIREEVSRDEAHQRITALNEPYKLEILDSIKEDPITIYHIGTQNCPESLSAVYADLSNDAGGGLVLWHPKGAIVRHISGHLDYYKENMYDQMNVEDELYPFRPMNCPYHILVYNRKPHSYHEFPIRVTELGAVYRHELSGSLPGLFRVRGFTQDDAHIFCLEDQIKDEIRGVLDLTEELLLQFGFRKYEVNLSTRPEKAVGDDDIWCFDLTYADSNSEKKRPIMIHRAVLGSLKRFFGVLREHYAGDFPLWLSPVQAHVLPVTDSQVCKAVASLICQLTQEPSTHLHNGYLGYDPQLSSQRFDSFVDSESLKDSATDSPIFHSSAVDNAFATQPASEAFSPPLIYAESNGRGFDGGFGGSDDPILPAPSEMLPEEGFALREWRR
ncbi:hypothetical protein C1H46_015735 [Malus baccata]|uniref:threonine--tRNA ligase n=1 Tax=Malus baccata TaxID=106549 RepID=A0A540MIS3_MALBA|nr:hypothetical protein C1H46_015735 [Malus baccata]